MADCGYNNIGDQMKYSPEITEKIARYEEKRGIKYAKTGGKLYSRLFWLGFIAWLYMFLMQLFYIAGRIIRISDGKGEWDNALITIVCATTVLLFSLPAYAFKYRLTAIFINIAAVIASFIAFAGITKVDDSASNSGGITEYDPGLFGLKKMFYWRHGIPIIIVFVISLILVKIIIKERMIVKRECEIISHNEYENQFETKDE